MRCSLLLAFVLFIFGAHAQDLKNFTPIKSAGRVPADFTTLSLEKVQADVNTIDQNQSRTEQKTKERFYLQSNYFIDDLLLSGRVLFNDPISNYVEEVGNKVLEQLPELQGKIRFYTIKSTVVNALATNQGIVFVDLGMVAQLENEAQLAYVLSHELVHYKNEHVLNAYVENNKIAKGEEAYRNTTYHDKILAQSSYSKELELEADAEGLTTYLKTGYDIKSVQGVFDVLQYSYLPFDDIAFDKSIFETEHMKYPESLLLEELTPISGDEDWDDTKSTHPNIRKRRDAVERILSTEEGGGSDEFLISELEFLQVRELARFEMTRLYLLNRDYANAIYNAYLLLQTHPDNKYLRTSIGKALYNLAVYKNAGFLTDVHHSYTDIEGESQQLFFFLEQLTQEELNTLAVNWNWQLKADYPDDVYIDALANGILKELVFENEMEPDDYLTQPPIAKRDTLDIPDTTKVDYSKLSKYEKIKLQKARGRSETPEEEPEINFVASSFIELFNNGDFVKQFDSLVVAYETFKEEEQDFRLQARIRAQASRRKARIRKRGRALGIDTITMVDPFYKRIDRRRRDAVRFVVSEAGQQNLVQQISTHADRLGMEMNMIDSKSLGIDDVESFNDMALLNEWLSERLAHENLDALSTDMELVKGLTEKYGSNYFGWSGVVSVTQQRPLDMNMLLLCGSLYGAPIALYLMAKPQHRTHYYSIVFNLKTADAVLVEYEKLSGKGTTTMLKSKIYDSLHQINSVAK